MSKVISIVGSSGSGKTTLIEKLIKYWTKQNLIVNVVKQTHHDVVIEPPHKDTARFRSQGAKEVLLVSPNRWQIVHEYHQHEEMNLNDILNRLGHADITLVEGFKTSDLPKIEVYRPENNKPMMCLDNPYLIAIASTQSIALQHQEIKLLDLNQVDELIFFIEDYLKLRFC